MDKYIRIPLLPLVKATWALSDEQKGQVLNAIIKGADGRTALIYDPVVIDAITCITFYIEEQAKHPHRRNWDEGEIAQAKRDRNSAEYAEWRRLVFERDGFQCQVCEKIGGKLNAHHIKPFAKYKELRFEVDNGITLCEECHKKMHRGGENAEQNP